MKKKIGIVLLAVAALALTGCGDKKEDKKDGSVATVTDGNVEFSLGEYKGLSEEKPVYAIDDASIDSEIESLLAEYTEYKDVDRESKSGDYINMYFTGTVGDEVILDYSADSEDGEEGYDLCLGVEEYGPEFDEKLTGVKAGDELDFSVTYDDEYEYEELAGSTVAYKVIVNGISEEIIPELTEDFVKNTLGYESEADMRAQITDDIKASNDEYSEMLVREALLQQIIDGSTFGGYSDELYAECKANIEEEYKYYMQMFGCESVQEVYDMFGVTEEDLENEITQNMQKLMVIKAIAEAENITVTDEMYSTRLDELVEEYGYVSDEDLESELGKEEIKSMILEELVMDAVVSYSNITEVETDETGLYGEEYDASDSDAYEDEADEE